MSHVQWPRLLPLSLRLNVAKAILEQGQAASVLLMDAGVSRVLRRVDDLSLSEAPEGDDEFRQPEESGDESGAPLEVYFAAVRNALIAKSKNDTSSAAKALANSIVSACLRGVCHACAASGVVGQTQICQWTEETRDSDAEAVEARGLCLDPIREIFVFCRDTARAAYSEALGANPEQSLTLVTSHTQQLNAQLGLRIDGETKERGRDSNERLIDITFLVEQFGIRDYLSLLYVMFHECFAHGYCGVGIVEPESDRSKAFHEGWMDCIAAAVLEDTLRVAPPANPNHPIALYADEYLRQMLTVRAYRFDQWRASPASDVIEWLCGADALETFRWLLARVLVEFGIPPHEVLQIVSGEVARLSIYMNGSDIPHATRAEFVAVLSRSYSRNNKPDRAKAVSARPAILEILGDFLGSGDVRGLVSAVVAIDP